MTHSEPSAHYVHVSGAGVKAIVRQYYSVAKIETAPAINVANDAMLVMQNLLFDKLTWVLGYANAQCVAVELVTTHKNSPFMADTSAVAVSTQPLQQQQEAMLPSAAQWQTCAAEFGTPY